MSYYKPSGKFNLALLIPGIIVGILISIAVAYAYIQLGSWMSFVIVKFLLLMGAIYGILEIVKLSNRIAKNRNKLISYILAFMFSVVVLYSIWIFFIVIELDQTFQKAFSDFWIYIDLVFSVQEYEVVSPISWFTESDGIQVNNWETYIVLGGESLFLLLGPLISIKLEYFDTSIFCENCNRWAKKEKPVRKKFERLFTTNQLEDMIVQEDLSPLLNLTDVSENGKLMFDIYEINQYCCPSCESTNYIKIVRDNTKISKEKSAVLLNYYKIGGGKTIADFGRENANTDLHDSEN